MNDFYIFHHLGLGDHIICNSIIRYYSKLYEKIYLFVYQHNYNSVKFMYRDLNNIDYISVNSDSQCDSFLFNITNFVRIGFDKIDVVNLHFDQSFYNQIGLNFNKRWNDFYVERDYKKEKEFFEKFGVVENEYIFVHDDKNVNKSIELVSDYKIIKPIRGLTDIIFDYLYLIENAREIHCIDSSFKNLIDSIDDINSDKLYMYPTLNQPENYYPITKKKWIKI